MRTQNFRSFRMLNISYGINGIVQTWKWRPQTTLNLKFLGFWNIISADYVMLADIIIPPNENWSILWDTRDAQIVNCLENERGAVCGKERRKERNWNRFFEFCNKYTKNIFIIHFRPAQHSILTTAGFIAVITCIFFKNIDDVIKCALQWTSQKPTCDSFNASNNLEQSIWNMRKIFNVSLMHSLNSVFSTTI